jgi:ribonuclease HII
VEAIKAPYHEIIIDGTINFLKDTAKGRYVTVLAKGDQLVPAISAASIIAKVARDAYMAEQEIEYPGYGFAAHVGYGTAAHRRAIEKLGVTPLHRRSFAPIAAIIGTTKAVGDEAETAVAAFLESAGHLIKARNWRTRYCEIDIVSEKDGVTYFTEVKYRRSARQGGGLAAITPAKLRQMRFAAEFYLANHPKEAGQARLAAASVTGNSIVEEFLEIE